MKKIAILFIAMLTYCTVYSQNNFNPFGGTGRTGAVSFVINDTVYVGLGKDGANHYKDFWKYSLKTDKWERIADFPGDVRAYSQAYSVNGKGYVGLGEYYKWNVADTTFRDFYSYNPTTNVWIKLNDFGGGARTKAVCFVIGSDAYIGTGDNADGISQKDFWKYNIVSDSWTKLTSEFSGDIRHLASAFTLNGKAYVTGGSYFPGYTLQLSDVQEYNPTTNSWTEKVFADGINLSFNDATAFGFSGKGYICYGNKNKIVSYDPVTNNIQDLGNLLNLEDKRMDPVSFILSNKAYFGLGYYSHADGSVWGVSKYDNSIYKFNLTSYSASSDIIDFSVGSQIGNSVIDSIKHTISAVVASNISLTNVHTLIKVSNGATYVPQDLYIDYSAGPVHFIVTAADGVTTQDWIVNVMKSNDKNIVTDRDGNVYKTVTIGTQVWMQENLRVSHYNNGDIIPNVTDNTSWGNLTSGAWCNYDNSTLNGDIYGKLYNWYAVQDTRKIAPVGWHIPTDADWDILTDYLGGGNVGGKLKEAGEIHWNSPNIGASNSSGFTALPSGSRYLTGAFTNLNVFTVFWSSTEGNISGEWFRRLLYSDSLVVSASQTGYNKVYGYSVRCVRDLPVGIKNTNTDIVEFSIGSQVGKSIIDTIKHTISAVIANNVSLTNVQTFIKVSSGATYVPQDLFIDYSTGSVNFTVTAEDGVTTQEWIVNVKIATSTAPVADIDGNVYKTVMIGNQLWMAENLKTTKYNDGTNIPNVTEGASWASLSTPAYCWYMNDNAYKTNYGALYNWYTVNTGKLCPTDWHVPSDAEWTILTDTLGGVLLAADKLKETGSTHWIDTNNGVTNETEFTALPGGTRYINGNFDYLGKYGYWWSASESTTDYSWRRLLHYSYSEVYRAHSDKPYGFSVRCVSDLPVGIKNTNTDIIEFSVGSQIGNSIIDSIKHTISAVVASNVSLTNVQTFIEVSNKATFIPQNLYIDYSSGPVNFTVTAENGSNQEWLVTVTKAQMSSSAEIELFSLPEQTGVALISYVNKLIQIEVVAGTDVSKLMPVITISEGASITPSPGEITDFSSGSVTYTVKAEDGTTQDWIVSVIKSNDTNIVTDIDGNVYKTVAIGTQVWMQENLKVSHYNNGDIIPNVTDYNAWGNLTSGAWCNYDNSSLNGDIYGKLYNWYAAQDTRKIAPVGWHVPTDSDWDILIDYLGGGNVGGKLKEAGEIHWNSPNTGASNSSGFTALPSGSRYLTGAFTNLNIFTVFWSSTEGNIAGEWFRRLLYSDSLVVSASQTGYNKVYGYSVRCVRNLPLSINKTNNNNVFQVYPNPAIDRIAINCSSNVNEMKIFNMMGNVVFQKQLINNKNEIDVSILSKGAYIIQLINSNGIMQQKLLKE